MPSVPGHGNVSALAPHCIEIPPPSVRRYGVYFLILHGEIVYVGQSSSIESRLRLHALKGVEFERVLWLELPREDLLRYEGALIRALLPPLNIRAPTYAGGDNDVLAQLGLPVHESEAEAVTAACAVLRSRGRPHRRPSKSDRRFIRKLKKTKARSRQLARVHRLWDGLAVLLEERAS